MKWLDDMKLKWSFYSLLVETIYDAKVAEFRAKKESKRLSHEKQENEA